MYDERAGGNPLRAARRASRSGGFTLLELLIVLFIITIVLAISTVVFMSALPSSRLSATARDLSSAIRHARALAQIKGETQTVTIDLDAKEFGIEGRGTKKISPEIGIKVTDPFTGDVHTGKYTLQAQVTGAVDSATIILWNKKKTVSVQTDPIVGAVVIK